MIYTITFNPSLDYIVSVDNFKAGNVNRTVSEKIMPGGKGINVSIVLKNLGVENVALGFIAGFTGDYIISELDKIGVKHSFVTLDNCYSRINVKIKSNIESEINASGPRISLDDIEKLYKRLDVLEDGDTLIIAGSVPSSLPVDIYQNIFEYIKHKDIRKVVDATGQLLLDTLKYSPFLIKPNIHELGELFGVELTSIDQIAEYGAKLQNMGAKNILVSLAGDGAILITQEGEELRMKACSGRLINSVGAGDSMVAGFLYGYDLNRDYLEALKYGTCAGGASAFSENLATKIEIMEQYKKL